MCDNDVMNNVNVSVITYVWWLSNLLVLGTVVVFEICLVVKQHVSSWYSGSLKYVWWLSRLKLWL